MLRNLRQRSDCLDDNNPRSMLTQPGAPQDIGFRPPGVDLEKVNLTFDMLGPDVRKPPLRDPAP